MRYGCTFPLRSGLGAREEGPRIRASCDPSGSSPHLPTSSTFLRFPWGQSLDPEEVSPHWLNKRGVNLARDLCPILYRHPQWDRPTLIFPLAEVSFLYTVAVELWPNEKHVVFLRGHTIFRFHRFQPNLKKNSELTIWINVHLHLLLNINIYRSGLIVIKSCWCRFCLLLNHKMMWLKERQMKLKRWKKNMKNSVELNVTD